MTDVIYSDGLGLGIDKVFGSLNPSSVFVIVDDKAPALATMRVCGLEVSPDFIVTPDIAETEKSIETVLAIVSSMSRKKLDRRSVVVVVGGGMTLDIGGFAASMYLRGLPTIYYPTTLLAMVDAAHGGKTGVNYDGAKNQLGSFHQPDRVIIDSSLVKDMPEDLLRDGLAETIKHYYIDGAKPGMLTESIERLKEQPLCVDEEHERHREYFSCHGNILEFLRAAISVKTRIVEADEKEQAEGGRELLNFGHTFGHAFEIENRLSHGAAVAFGMVAAFEMGVREGLIDRDTAMEQKSFIKNLILPGEPLSIVVTQRHIDLIEKDKKMKDGLVSFILPKRNGRKVECVSMMLSIDGLENILMAKV